MKRPYSLVASSSSSSSNHYEVFLSFRGDDTRNNFTSHLYRALRQTGIHTFFDDDALERGKMTATGLQRAIEGSRCSVVILSKGYASSRWCLDELVHILQCMNDLKQIVLPIFYLVDPSHVRNQTGELMEEAFERHEQDHPEKVQAWRSALKQVGNLTGWHLDRHQNEAQFIEKFIEVVWSRFVPSVNILKDFVGMDSRLKELNLCVSKSQFEIVRYIGICGMPGVGKTTLAKAYFRCMSPKFEASSFLANVREKSLAKFQSQLLYDILKEKHEVDNDVYGEAIIERRLCTKKVLVILDDVDDLKHIDGLAKSNWFGCGSTIILTTRDEGLLIPKKEYAVHKLDRLGNYEALQLFSRKAFGSDCPSNGYNELSRKVIEYADGLPLAIEVLGSFFGRIPLDNWDGAWNRLKAYPNKEITEALLFSFNELEEPDQNIFLDIACFFNGKDKCEVTKIMNSCDFFGGVGISTLLNKSLLYVDHDDKLRMHDSLQEMGMKIARGQLGNEPRRRSRIWDENDFHHFLNTDTGIEEVEAMACQYLEPPEEIIKSISGAFSKMKKLRLLIMHLDEFQFDECWSSCTYLPNELRYLEWEAFPFKCFPPSFQPQGLVQLQLHSSQIEQLWNGPMEPLYNLKYIDLSYSDEIRKLEGFSLFPNLEELILDRCGFLEEIDPSITVLERLTLLSLNSCTSLESLPSMQGLESLKLLSLQDCFSLCNLPEDLGCLTNLEKLDVRHAGIEDVPSSISGLKALKSLYFGQNILGPNERENILSTIGGKGPSSAGLSCLKKLELEDWSLSDGEILEDFGWLLSLEHLNLSKNYISCLPDCINRLSKLRYLDLTDCKNLESLDPELPDSLEMVKVEGCTSLHTFLDPLSQCNLQCSAICTGCSKLQRRQGSKRTAVTSLGRHLQKPFSPSRKRFDIVLPAGGVEIPSWFNFRDWGSSISISPHPNWCNSEWMGFALCVCLVPKVQPYALCWKIKINGEDWGFGLVKSVASRWLDDPHNHIWLLYLPRDTYFRREWQNVSNAQIEFSVESERSSDPQVVSETYGLRLVYKHDIEILNQTARHEPLEPNCRT